MQKLEEMRGEGIIFRKDNIVYVLIAFIIGILFHFTQVANSFFNGDTVGVGGYYSCQLGELAQGRFGLLLFSNRVINGTMEIMVAIFIYAVSSVVILNIFDVSKKIWVAVLVQLVFMSQPHLAFYTSFLYVVAPYSLAYFLAICSVWMIKQSIAESKKYQLLYVGGAIFCLGFSFSIWQGYIPTFTSLVLLLFLFTEEFKNKKKVVLNSAVVGVLAIICYVVLMKGVNFYYNVETTEARGFKDTLALNIPLFTDPIQTVKDIYSIFFDYLLKNNIVYNGKIQQSIHIILVFLGLFCFTLWQKNKTRKEWAINIITLLLIPVGFVVYRCINILCADSPWTYLHSMVYVWILFLIVVSRINTKKVTETISVLLVAIVILGQVYICNTCYSSLQERMNKSYAMATTMFTRISEFEGWTSQTPVMVYGSMDEIFQDKNDYYDYTLKGWAPQVNEFLPYPGMPQNWMVLINNIYGTKIPWVQFNWKEWDEILENKEFRSLEIWPSKNSMKIIDDILVIKLSEHEAE